LQEDPFVFEDELARAIRESKLTYEEE